jgi:hypothetical protein
MPTEPTNFLQMTTDYMLATASNNDIPVHIRKKCLSIVEGLNTIESYERRQALQETRDAMPKKGAKADG